MKQEKHSRKKFYVRLWPLVLMSFFAEACHAQFGYDVNALSLSYGSTYRFDQTYRHLFAIDYWNLNGACTRSEYSGAGISLEWTNKSCYNVGLRYFRSPQRYPAASGVILYLGVAPDMSFIQGNYGFNIAPLAGVHIPLLIGAVGGGVNLYYGYDIPVISALDYELNRNSISLKLNLELDTKCLRISNWRHGGKKVDAQF